MEAEATVDCADRNGLQSLHHAQESNESDMIAFLVRMGANVEARTSQGYTSLQLACIGNASLAIEAY